MPYEWSTAPDAGARRLRLWPHRSLPATGFVWFIGLTAALLAVPLVGLLGSPVLWGLLPFVLAALWAIWAALRRSSRDGEILEDLVLGFDLVTLVRDGPRGLRQDWQANPHWVEVVLHPQGGPVPQYLTLRGGGREVELGAFLSEDERLALAEDVRMALVKLRSPRPS